MNETLFCSLRYLRKSAQSAVLLLFLLSAVAFADEPFFKKGDVIALVGGEDMVAASEYGYLELLLTRALPEHRLKFRCLAWEGDTVFEQRRDLNFPSLEKQLEMVGATVVIAQFGQMESLAGKEKLPEFVAAYEKLIERINSAGKRRVILLAPAFIRTKNGRDVDSFWNAYVGDGFRFPHQGKALFTALRSDRDAYANAVEQLAAKVNATFMAVPNHADTDYSGAFHGTRDGFHLDHIGHFGVAVWIQPFFGLPADALTELKFSGHSHVERFVTDGTLPFAQDLHQLIRVKDRLWHDYWRVQNWAFLAGDRTNQPSSRDHRDPTKRWFPEERERFLPLIEKKEQEIWDLAAKLAKP